MTTEATHQIPSRALASEARQVTALGCVATAAAGMLLTVRVEVGPWFGPTALAVFASIMAVVLATITRHHPFDRFGPANVVTTIRAVLTALVVAFLAAPAPHPGTALGAALLGLVVVVMDGVDGRLARQSRMQSPFGARYDLEVDALLILALSALVYRHEKAGVWVLASGLLRYLFVLTGVAWAWMRRPLEPSRRRQTVCVIQIAGLLLALAPFVHVPASVWLSAVALAILTWSFGVDVLWLWRGRR